MLAFMNRLIRRLDGGRGPRHVAPTIVLGAVAGAVAGWNLTFALLITATALFNGPLVLLTAAFCGGMVVSRAHELTRRVGYFLLEKVGLNGIVESLGHGVTSALLRWDDYQLVGGAAITLIASLPAAHLAARRASVHVPTSEVPAEPLLRRYGVFLAAAWLVIFALVGSSAAPHHVGRALLARLSAAAGAPVVADSVSFNLRNGDLELRNLRIGDPNDSQHCLVQIERATAQVDAGLLLRDRLRCSELVIEGITCEPTAVHREKTKLFAAGPILLREAGATAREPEPGRPLGVHDYVHDWPGVTQRLAALRRLIGTIEGLAELEDTRTAGSQRLAGAARPASAPHDSFSGQTIPLVEVEKIRISGLSESWQLSRTATLELAHATSRPASAVRPVQLSIDDAPAGFHLGINFRLTTNDRRHDLTATWTNGSAESILNIRRLDDVGIEISQAAPTSVRGRGWATRSALELPLSIEVRGVQVEKSTDRFGGLNCVIWQESLMRLGGLRFDANLGGPWDAPRLDIVPVALVDQLKHQLRAAGEHALVKSVEAGRQPTTTSSPESVATKPDTAKPEAAKTVETMKSIAAAVATTPDAKPAIEAKSAVTSTAGSVAPPVVTVTPPAAVQAAIAPPVVVMPTASVTPMQTPPSPVAPSTGPLAPPVVLPSGLSEIKSPPTTPEVPRPPEKAVSRGPIVAAPVPPPASQATPNNAPPANDTVRQTTLIEPLRQPRSVLNPSAGPGPISGTPGYERVKPLPPPTASHRSDSAAVPPVASAMRPTVPPVQSSPSVAAATPKWSERVVPQAPPKKQGMLAGMKSWFTGEEDCEMLPPEGVEIVPPPQTASKSMFSRFRGRMAGDSQKIEDPFTLPSAPPTQSAPPQSPVPQTAREPWYDRMFR